MCVRCVRSGLVQRGLTGIHWNWYVGWWHEGSWEGDREGYMSGGGMGYVCYIGDYLLISRI